MMYFELGIEEVKDMSSNMVKVYEQERTVCDIIRSKNKME